MLFPYFKDVCLSPHKCIFFPPTDKRGLRPVQLDTSIKTPTLQSIDHADLSTAGVTEHLIFLYLSGIEM